MSTGIKDDSGLGKIRVEQMPARESTREFYFLPVPAMDVV
jgi:hypothetical protein